MSNSSLASYIKLSPNKTSPRNHSIDTITIHCVVGQYTAKTILNMKHFVNYDVKNGASCNYAIGYDGSIGLGVDEKDRSWCSSSSSNDHRAVTIEVASDTYHPYAVTDKAYNALIELCVDICKRNNIKELKWKGDKSLIGQTNLQNMTVHRWFASKDCPGDYLYERHGQIADAVNKKLKALLKPTFSDISGHYAENHINKLFDYKVINGYADGTYQPNKTINRAEFSVIVFNVLKKVCGLSLDNSFTFIDIKGHWAEQQISKLSACRIVNGYEDGTFRPEISITRGQTAIIASNMLSYYGIEKKDGTGFPDIVGHYAEKDIKSLRAFGVINGYEDGTFKPDDEITRGQAAIIVSNCLSVLGK